jgi:hypothetical protein
MIQHRTVKPQGNKTAHKKHTPNEETEERVIKYLMLKESASYNELLKCSLYNKDKLDKSIVSLKQDEIISENNKKFILKSR